MSTENSEKILEKLFPFWENLSENEKNALLKGCHEKDFKKGETLHDSNECTGVIIVKSGSLRLYMLSDEGKEITLYRLREGEMCMLSASCVIKAITFDVFVDAEEDSRCIILSGSAFSQVSESNKDVKIFALSAAVSRFSDVMWVMQQILFMSMDKRLAVFLLDECAKTSSDTVTLTHEQIAKYIGSAREVVSRMLKYFSNEGLVQVSRKGIKILDKTGLRQLSS